MIYDLKLIAELSKELGFNKVKSTEDLVEIEIFENASLVFQNIDGGTDSLVGFRDAPSHSHGDMMFSGPEGRYIEMPYVDIISEIRKGKVLVCELHNSGILKDRFLVHKDLVDEFKYMEPGDEIRVRQCA
ncbi:MAG: hypothetical protein KUG83_08295 [Gammaproteobacteria bacterium]|nr:hypothetical protein [Gammaproteobacteria bacterium]